MALFGPHQDGPSVETDLAVNVDSLIAMELYQYMWVCVCVCVCVCVAVVHFTAGGHVIHTHAMHIHVGLHFVP